jgi:hypothetical protein
MVLQSNKLCRLFILKDLLVNNNYNHYYKPKKRRSSSKDNDNSELGLLIFCIVAVAFLFVKYHEFIMDYFTGFIVLALASTFTIAIKLHMRNQYDNLNRFWTAVSLVIIIVDCITLFLMSKQDLASISTKSFSDFIETAGISGVLRYGYYALGFILAQLPNILLLILLLHMYAVNSYLARGGHFAQFIIRKTSPFTIKPVHFTVVVAVICIMSLLFTSGVLFNLISKQQKVNVAILINAQK